MMTSHTQRKDRIKEMKQDKERAYDDFIAMIKNSWTWERLTEDERVTFTNNLQRIALLNISGSYLQRYHAYHACYDMYLRGLGYDDWHWREPEPKYEWVVSYEDGEELSRFDTYEDALYQVKTMWEVDHVEAFITKVEVENPKF